MNSEHPFYSILIPMTLHAKFFILFVGGPQAVPDHKLYHHDPHSCIFSKNSFRNEHPPPPFSPYFDTQHSISKIFISIHYVRIGVPKIPSEMNTTHPFYPILILTSYVKNFILSIGGPRTPPKNLMISKNNFN